MDTWFWTMGGICEFSVKALKQMVNLKILGEEADMDETKWCKYIPNKVSVFMWHLKHGCLPVRALLDWYGMDLDTTLFPMCNEVVESLDHCFVSCCKAKSLWNKVFDWWSLNNFYGSSIADILNVDESGVFPNSLNPCGKQWFGPFSILYGNSETKACSRALKTMRWIYCLRYNLLRSFGLNTEQRL